MSDTISDLFDYAATSVDVEWLFSQGHVLLSHIHNHLSSQSVQALICLGSWSWMGLVKDADLKKVVMMKDVVEGKDHVLPEGWDVIDEL